MSALGWQQTNRAYFDTLRFERDAAEASAVRRAAEARGINFRYPAEGVVQISLDETVSEADLADIVAAFEDGSGASAPRLIPPATRTSLPDTLRRRSAFLTHPVFNAHHSETEMMRYIRRSSARTSGSTRR